MPTLSINSSSLFVGLTKAATLFTNAMFARTNTSHYPSHKEEHNRIIYTIQESTRIGVPTPAGNQIYIDIIIDLKKAPYAYAYEFGHTGDYPIPKTGSKKMVFPKEDWPKFVPSPGKSMPNIFVFYNVTHHGIEARPFLDITMKEKRKEITALIGKEFKEAYIRSIGERRIEIK